MCVLLLLFLLSSPCVVPCDEATKNICQEVLEWDIMNNEKMIEVTNSFYDAYLTDILSSGSNAEDYNAKYNTFETYVVQSEKEANAFLEHKEEVAKCGNATLLEVLDHYKTQTKAASSKDLDKLINEGDKTMKAFFENPVEIDGQAHSVYGSLVEHFGKERDYKKLWSIWTQYHDQATSQLKGPYEDLVKLRNERARSQGYSDIANEWLMTEFNDTTMESNMLDLLRDMFPLYTRVHAYVRHKMFEFYKKQVTGESEEITKVFSDPKSPIPIHILGDLWGQAWGGIGDIVAPYPEVEFINITKILEEKNFDPIKLMKLAESFFTSMGLEKMTDTFWQKSRFEKEGKMDCSAIAYDMKKKDDYRIFMCTKMDDLYYYAAHHEMGHVVNYMLYSDQPLMYKDFASPCFSEAIGDTIVLSARSRKHLKAIGFLEETAEDDEEIIKKQRINDLMQKSLVQVVFLPFTYIIDKWRFGIFRGEITPDEYNKKWWEIRNKYSGISSPCARPDEGFDAGSKLQIPYFYSFIRYFYSFVGQFEFHEALCKAAGQTADFDNCDIYNSVEAGNKLREFLSVGSSEAWRVSLEKLTGFDHFRSEPFVNYFKVLDEWLVEYLDKNQIPIGWEGMWEYEKE